MVMMLTDSWNLFHHKITWVPVQIIVSKLMLGALSNWPSEERPQSSDNYKLESIGVWSNYLNKHIFGQLSLKVIFGIFVLNIF